MADHEPNFPKGDLSPTFRMSIRDQRGLRDLTVADSVTLWAKTGSTIITGPIDPIDPPEEDEDDPTLVYNAEYVWQRGDTDVPGRYVCQVEVVTAGKPETFPSGQDGVATSITFHIPDRVVSAADLP